MASYICFICSSTSAVQINEETREKYRDVVGTNLNLDSQLCYICCHLLNKLSIFSSLCLKRSFGYPVVLSAKPPITLQKSDLEIHILCPEQCNQYTQRHNTVDYQPVHSDDYDNNDNTYNEEYIKLDDDNHHEYGNGIEQFDYDTDNDKIGSDNVDGRDYVEMKLERTETFNDLYKDMNDKDLCNQYDKSNDNLCNTINKNVYNITIEVNDDIQHNDTIIDTPLIVNDTALLDTEPVDVNSKIVKKKGNRGYKRIVLSLDKQKAELEANRKKKKYLEAEFKCYNCALGFLFKDTYQAHMMRHEESNGEFQCDTCTLRFATLVSLRIHSACHSERHRCRTCGESLKPRAKRRHSCFNPVSAQSVACHLCGNLLKDANGLQQHLKRVHASKASGRCYVCSVCGDSYTRQGALRTHMIKHINRKFHCDQCPGVYSSPYTLTQHKKTHQSDGSMHHCGTCGAGYATRKSLLAHIRNTSNHQTATFECPICSRVCPNQKSLASHIQSVHSTTKDYTCDLCPARYTNRKSLVRHIGSHKRKVEVKTVICHLCGTNFKGNSKLNRHLREVCKKSKEQPSAYE